MAFAWVTILDHVEGYIDPDGWLWAHEESDAGGHFQDVALLLDVGSWVTAVAIMPIEPLFLLPTYIEHVLKPMRFAMHL